jgi:hypothetical protein
MIRIRRDQDWLSTWSEPLKIAATLDRELHKLFSRMANCAGCQRGHGRAVIEELAAAVHVAIRSPIPKHRRRRPRRTTKALTALRKRYSRKVRVP